ncbi:hypothetical protein Tco_1420134 [Tanacetum coccineum]
MSSKRLLKLRCESTITIRDDRNWHTMPRDYFLQLESLKLLQRQLFRSLEDWEVSSLQCMQRGGQLNATSVLEVENFTNWKKRYKALMNELVNDGINLSKLEINTGFINGLPKKWLSFCQSLRNTNHVKDSELASLFGKLKYEENLIDSIYETKKNKSLVSATPLSTAFFSSSIVQDFQDCPGDEEDTRSSHEYLNDLEEEYQARALLAKSRRFFKKGTQRFSSAKATCGN